MWKARSKRLVVLALWGCVFILLGEIADVYPWVDIIGDILIVVAILILLGIYVWQGDN